MDLFKINCRDKAGALSYLISVQDNSKFQGVAGTYINTTELSKEFLLHSLHLHTCILFSFFMTVEDDFQGVWNLQVIYIRYSPRFANCSCTV